MFVGDCYYVLDGVVDGKLIGHCISVKLHETAVERYLSVCVCILNLKVRYTA